MDLLLPLTLSFVAGMLLGGFYFGGLWWTVNRLDAVAKPHLFVVVSLVLRLAIVVAGFYVVMGGQADRLAVCLLGFLVMRFVLVRRWGPIRRAAT